MLSLKIESPSDADQRIDKFIKKYLPDAPLGGIYKWLRTGKIKVNQRKVDQVYRIIAWDQIDIYLRDNEILWFQKKEATFLKWTQRSSLDTKIVPSILYEDDFFLVINKNPRLNVHPGDHKTKEVSLIEMVQDYLSGRYNTLSFRPALVHRIDRDTSGAIIIAKDKSTLESLLILLQSWKIEKIYHTLVVGKPPKARDSIRAKLLRIENAQNEAKVRIDNAGQEAVTHYRTINTNIRDKYSLLEVSLETWRMHQIRVHMASIGCPILWDKAYGNKWENSFARREYSIERQMLHAERLRFIHPKTKKPVEIIAPYHGDMTNLIFSEKENIVNSVA